MKRLTLAEAIREGSTLTDPLRFEMISLPVAQELSSGYALRGKFQACALGAALCAVVGPAQAYYASYEQADIMTALRDLYPEILQTYALCPGPVCESTYYVKKGTTLENMIAHLNDRHGWTREAIADWLDTLTLDLSPVRQEQEV